MTGRIRSSCGADALTASAVAVVFVTLVAASLPAADNARQIVEEAQRRSQASSQRYDGLLQVFDSKGKISDKRWTYERLGSNGESKAVLRFTAPAEVKGVALLIVNHPDRASDQWMWTPAIERERRIALQDRSTRFFGTDFSFEDLEERDVDHYDYRLEGVEPIDGAPCWKIRVDAQEQPIIAVHARRSCGSGRTTTPGRASRTSRRSQVVRRLAYSDIQNVQGIWTARQLEMTDLMRGSRTRLTLEKLQYNLPLRDADFTLQALRRN